jgi:hypothetical protein
MREFVEKTSEGNKCPIIEVSHLCLDKSEMVIKLAQTSLPPNRPIKIMDLTAFLTRPT